MGTAELDLLERTPGEEFALRRGAPLHLERSLTTFEVRTLVSTGEWQPKDSPLAPIPRRKRVFVQDLMRRVPVTSSPVPYVRELNPITNEGGASAVAEGGTKPEVAVQFDGAEAPVATIAAWVPVTGELRDDAPLLAAYVDTRLSYMLKLREEAQILSGDGTPPNLRGIRLTTGVQTQAAISGDYPATLIRAIEKVELVDGAVDAIALHPTDWATMTLTRHATDLDALDGFADGVAFIRTRAMPQGKALVGSYFEGATIADRRDTTIALGVMHDDFWTRNKVAVRADQREGLVVSVPAYFCEATLG